MRKIITVNLNGIDSLEALDICKIDDTTFRIQMGERILDECCLESGCKDTSTIKFNGKKPNSITKHDNYTEFYI